MPSDDYKYDYFGPDSKVTSDEQKAREFLQGRRMPLNMEENAEWHQSLAALLARRALEARKETLEEAALCALTPKRIFGPAWDEQQRVATAIRSLAAASKAGGERT